ncbi:hypothetical protein CCP4SC76_7230012 [Gammaproteobacteria bacterium]
MCLVGAGNLIKSTLLRKLNAPYRSIIESIPTQMATVKQQRRAKLHHCAYRDFAILNVLGISPWFR